MTDALNTRQDKTIPTRFLITLMMQVLSYNVFTFGTLLFIQLIGSAMGTRSAPTIANIFMTVIDKMLRDCARSQNPLVDPILFFKRFIDDIFLIWTGTVSELETFLTEINKLHKTIKFTANYDFTTKSTTFLDTVITIKNGTLTTDLYRKPTDKVQYLLPTSCHPSHIFSNIPYSLALRLVRICSTPACLNQRLHELSVMLQSRNYNTNIVKAAIQKASLLDRSETLKKVVKPQNDRVVLAITYHPCLTNVSTVLRTHWNTMTQDPTLKKVFTKPPMLAFKQPPNLRSLLVRARII